MPFVDRTTFIELLEKLRHEDDAEVLAAAKEISRRMDEGGVTWEEVLVGGAQDDDDEDGYGYDDADEDNADDAPPADTSGDTALIEKLLARDDLSEETREELEDYKEDIAEGEFSAADSRYLQALAKRISG